MKAKKFVKEAGEMNEADRIYEKTKIQAAKIRSKAELLRAKNQLKSAQLNQARINNKIKVLDSTKKAEEDSKAKVKTVGDRQPQPQQQQVVQRQAPVQPKRVTAQEARFYKSQYWKYIHEADEQPDVEIAGTTPQTKEEAETARIQAATREIQARIGEYGGGQFGQQGGGDPNADPAAAGGDPMSGDPSMDQAMGGDPMTGDPGMDPAMGGDPNMMGGPGAQPPPDPLKGFGDASAPMDMMGGNIDPATGMPSNEPKITYSALGRLYHLKKIYNRLLSLNKILIKYPYEEVIPIRKDVREMLELMSLVNNNLKSYKKDIDEIIVNMYAFLKETIQNLNDIVVKIKQQSPD